MINYSLKLAILNLRDRLGLTLLTIAAIAIGLALLTTMTTMSYQSNKIPIKHKSDHLFFVSIDSRDTEAQPFEDPWNGPRLTFRDAENIINSETPASRQTYLWKSFAFLNNDKDKVHPRQVRIMAGQSNFFSLFDVPFLYGSPWSKESDSNSDTVIILSEKMNDHFFGGENSVGRRVRINSTEFTVIGVLARWKIPSRFYDRSFSHNRFDDAFIPSSLAMKINLPRQISCWSKDQEFLSSYSRKNIQGLKTSECTWIDLWAEIDSKSDQVKYQQFINRYVEQQKSFGRFPRQDKNMVLSLKETIEMISSNFGASTIFQILSFLFFLVCLINTIGILLAKYMGKVPEIALRRALGAKRQVVMMQYLIEIAIISFIGGVIGILLSYFGLQAMMKIEIYQSDYTLTSDSIKHIYQLDWIMIGKAILIAVGSTLLVSLLPVWKICNTPPAGQLKSQ